MTDLRVAIIAAATNENDFPTTLNQKKCTQ